MTRRRIKPIRSIVGLGLIVVLLVATPSGFAETIQRAPCEAVESGDFERYRERQLATLKAEQAAATRQGLRIRIVRDLDSDLGAQAANVAANVITKKANSFNIINPSVDGCFLNSSEL